LCESDASEWSKEGSTMKKRRHTPEQVIRKLAEGEKLVGQGQSGSSDFRGAVKGG